MIAVERTVGRRGPHGTDRTAEADGWGRVEERRGVLGPQLRPLGNQPSIVEEGITLRGDSGGPMTTSLIHQMLDACAGEGRRRDGGEVACRRRRRSRKRGSCFLDRHKTGDEVVGGTAPLSLIDGTWKLTSLEVTRPARWVVPESMLHWPWKPYSALQRAQPS